MCVCGGGGGGGGAEEGFSCYCENVCCVYWYLLELPHCGTYNIP